jgi:hypothetical protein
MSEEVRWMVIFKMSKSPCCRERGLLLFFCLSKMEPGLNGILSFSEIFSDLVNVQ